MAYSDCPPRWALLPAAAVPLGLDQAGISRQWSHHKEGILTIHKTQLVIDKTQDHIHNRAKLWRETSGSSGGKKLGSCICPSMTVVCGPCPYHGPGERDLLIPIFKVRNKFREVLRSVTAGVQSHGCSDWTSYLVTQLSQPT